MTEAISPAAERTVVYTQRVEFGDCDPARIVWFPNFFRWIDAASRHFFVQCGVPSWHETEAERGIIGTPLVDAQASFRNPATYGEDLDIESWVETWKTKSFVMRHVARRGDTVIAEGREVRVFAVREAGDPTRIRAVPIPAAWRALCE